MFANAIFTALQFYVQLPLLYTVWSNASSEIGPEVMLWPLTTSCVKDYKGHSLVQTSFTEPPIGSHHLLRNYITLWGVMVPYKVILSCHKDMSCRNLSKSILLHCWRNCTGYWWNSKFNTRLPPLHTATLISLKDCSLHICMHLLLSISHLVLCDSLMKSFSKSWKPISKRLVGSHLCSWPLVSGRETQRERTQRANFQGNPFFSSYRTTLKQHLNCEKWDVELAHFLFLVELCCFHVQCIWIDKEIVMRKCIWIEKEIVMQKSKQDHTTLLLKELHWHWTQKQHSSTKSK